MMVMNLLEIITEYVRLCNASGRGDADKWLHTQFNKNSPLIQHVRNCWIDREPLALQEARRIMEMYEIEPDNFTLKAEQLKPDEKSDPVGWYRIKATHKEPDYEWVGYKIVVYVNHKGEFDCPEGHRIDTLDPESGE